ncbi:hypothetical protein [Providencia huaxiensis]|uniref:hypothetical protein n=1 Tax=Providencia huaxiensis TaxID=2027290 RepID=UPI0034DCCBC8
MQDLMPPINTPDSAFHDGDPTTGQLGTIVTALWLNNVQAATRDVQLEIKNVLAKAGIQPDPKKTNQLAEAISQIIGSGNYASTAYVDNGLNKKIDKASISGVLGNDNNKVPSLNLVATELGKKQPKGDYALKGDSYTKTESDGRYASKQEASDKIPLSSIANSFGSSKTWVMSQDIVTRGLNEKFDKSGGEIAGAVEIKTSGRALRLSSSDKDKAIYFDLFGGNERVAYVGFGSDGTNNFTVHNQKTGQTLRIGDDISANGHRVLTTQDTQIPIGASLLWNTSAPIPDNFWANEGRAFSASEYPELAKVFPSLRLHR